MNLTLDIKTLITVGGLIAVLGGFYYSTQHRLSSLEASLDSVSAQLDEQSGELKQIQKQIRRLDK
tara:strand:- start:184 stop:378 length:195 start_codon:yes stop_codon:yes gene_type:complete